MAQSGVYSESGIDYLKRVVQVVDLEFKIKPETKGSSTYLYSCTTGINRDSKDMAPVRSLDIEFQQACKSGRPYKQTYFEHFLR